MTPTTSSATRKRPRTTEVAVEPTTCPPPSKRRSAATATATAAGIYVPPHRATDANDESAAGYERRTWDALRRSITALVNKATAANIRHVASELLSEDLIRGRGLLCRALLRAQAACAPSFTFTPVFAALAASANARHPRVGRLLLARLARRATRALAAEDTRRLAAAATFVAHLVNQRVATDLLALQLLALLLGRPTTDGGVEVAVGVVTHCGAKLQESCPRGLRAVFDCLRSVLHDGEVDKRVQFLIEDLFAIRKAQFRGHPPVQPELDLVEPDDQVTHQIELSLDDDDQLDPEFHLDVFEPSHSFGDDDKIQSSSPDDEETDSDDDDESETEPAAAVRGQTDTDLINLRRTIYLTVMSSVSSEEAGHKLLSAVRPGQEPELCAMLVECCRKEKACNTSYYGELGRRLCGVDRAYQAGFEACFAGHYSGAHRMTTDELRASAGFYAHLLAADALPWRGALGRVRVTEQDTTSSSRIFIKMLLQDLAERLGVRKLSRKMNEDDADVRDVLFPRDCARNTRFAINFFTAIGLGGVTESARKLIV